MKWEEEREKEESGEVEQTVNKTFVDLFTLTRSYRRNYQGDGI